MHKLEWVQASGIFDQNKGITDQLQGCIYCSLMSTFRYEACRDFLPLLALPFSNINIVWALPWLRKTTFISKAVFIHCLKRISFQFHYILALATCYGPCKIYTLRSLKSFHKPLMQEILLLFPVLVTWLGLSGLWSSRKDGGPSTGACSVAYIQRHWEIWAPRLQHNH